MYKLSPSDFAYLYEDCKLCYWLKVKKGIMPPPSPFPGVFSSLNTMVQGQMVGHKLSEFGKDLPEIMVESQEGFVNSKVVPSTDVYIYGKYDLLCSNGDGTYTIVDLKISKPDVGKIDKYKTQLGAYKFALENPKEGEGIKVTRLALLIFYPEKASYNDRGAVVDFPAKWLEIPADDRGFVDFMKEVNSLLSGDAPAESETCGLCNYRHHAEEISHHINNSNSSDDPF